MAESGSVSKLPKLTSSRDFMHWLRRMYAYLRREDFELICFSERPTTGSAVSHRKWIENMVKAKSSIILTLGTLQISQVNNVIDDEDRSAKVLRDALINLYTLSNDQSVSNLEQELETLRLEDGQS